MSEEKMSEDYLNIALGISWNPVWKIRLEKELDILVICVAAENTNSTRRLLKGCIHTDKRVNERRIITRVVAKKTKGIQPL